MKFAIKMGMSVSEFLESRPIDLDIFLKAKREGLEEQMEQTWDYTRHLMWASMVGMIGEKTPKMKVMVPLKRDKKIVVQTPFEKQKIAEWAKEMDKEMGIK